jgi:long-chain fatty acid transport protein
MLLPRGRALRALLALPLFALPAGALASGFALESQGARAMGFSGAYVAQAADPSAIYYNAAGIGFLRKQSLYLGGQFGALTTDFTGEGPTPPAGTVERSSRGLGLLPAFYYSSPVSERTVVGIGLYRPFGFRSEWDNPDQFTGRYICTDCRIGSWSINPTLAYKVADRLAVGIGVDVRLSEFKHVRRLLATPNPFPQPTDVAQMTFESGTKAAVGWNVGLLASPNENVTIGLAYRHKVTINHDAQVGFVQILTGDAAVDDAVAASLPANQVATAGFTYPASFSGGIAVKHGYWTIEGDLSWTYWSTFDAVSLRFPSTPAFDVSLPQDYESTWRGAIGLEYLIRDDWELRGGYSYDHSPQPTPTLSPFLQDEDRHGLAVGGSYKHENLRLDLVGRLLLFRDRSTRGLSQYGYDGLYQTDGFSLGVSVGYRF